MLFGAAFFILEWTDNPRKKNTKTKPKRKSRRQKKPPLTFGGDVFVLLAFAPVVLAHGRFDALGKEQLDGVTGVGNHLRRNFQLRLFHRPQDVFFPAAERMIGAATEPQSCESGRAERTEQRPGTVVAACAALSVNTNRAPRQLHFIPQGEQVLRTKLVLFEQLANRDAAQVHVGLRLG